jgi:hypothetical protein
MVAALVLSALVHQLSVLGSGPIIPVVVPRVGVDPGGDAAVTRDPSRPGLMAW